MSTLAYEIPIQLAVIALVTLAVYRDADIRRRRFGAAPGGVSLRTWAALCGLLWVPVLYYVAQRKRQDHGELHEGNDVKRQWWMLTIGLAVAWLATDIAANRTPAIVEHVLFLGLVLAGWVWATKAKSFVRPGGVAVPTARHRNTHDFGDRSQTIG
ncbi:MAG: hypothetical protein NVS3B21_19660 [Acidimicrobiales bacterium]